jgi:MFS transporter, ACS family, tartrate transporter
MKDLTGSYAGGLYGLALFGLVSAFVCAFFLNIPDPAAPVRAPEALRAAQ